MKTIVKVLLVVTFASMILSCTSAPLSNRISDYISEVEANCATWTESDWEMSEGEYAALIEEYRQNYDSYTQEERAAINKAIGRYNGLRLKHGLEEFGDTVKEIGEQLPSLVEGFMSAFE